MKKTLFFPLTIVGLLAILTSGCAQRPDPYGRQVSRALDASLRGQDLLGEGEDRRAEKSFQKSLQINRSIDNPVGAARQLNNLAAVALTRGDVAEAKNLFHQALLINQDLGDTGGAAINLANLATVAQKGGDLPKAARYLEQARDQARLSERPRVRGQVLCQMAGLALDQHDPGSAAGLLEEARPAAREAEVRGSWNYQQGRLSLARGDTVKALPFFQQALAADRQILNRTGMGADLLGLGEAWEAQGDYSQSFLYFGRAFELYEAIGSRDKARLCLQALSRVNRAGGLGRSLKPYEQQLATDRTDPTCPPPGAAAAPDKTKTAAPPPTTAVPGKAAACPPGSKPTEPADPRK